MTTIQPAGAKSRLLDLQSLRTTHDVSGARRVFHAGEADAARASSARTERISGAQRIPSTALLERLRAVGFEIRPAATDRAQAPVDAPAPGAKAPVEPGASASSGEASDALPSFEVFRSNFGKQGATVADGDLNGDGAVDLADLALYRKRELERSGPALNAAPDVDTIRKNFGLEDASYEHGDLNGDGRVDLADLSIASQSSSVDVTG